MQNSLPNSTLNTTKSTEQPKLLERLWEKQCCHHHGLYARTE